MNSMAKPGTVTEIKEQLSRLDPQDMWGAIASFPEQLDQASGVPLPEAGHIDTKRIDNIVFCGMGGSAIGGDLLMSYLGDDLPIPMIVNRNYTLPGFVNDRTLVVVSSYSGNTEETLSAYHLAEERGAQILGISTNGEVGEQFKSSGWPLIEIPGGKQPRAALGFSFIPMVRMFGQLGLTKYAVDDAVNETIDIVTELSRKYAGNQDNIAYNSAKDLVSTVPIIYTPPELAVVGTRWKGQLAENAQMLAFANVIPEMNHNEIMGWEPQTDLISNKTIIWLSDGETHPRIKKRIEITAELLKESVLKTFHFNPDGQSWMTRLFSLIYLGDWISLYAALIREIDPTAIEQIELLKKRLND